MAPQRDTFSFWSNIYRLGAVLNVVLAVAGVLYFGRRVIVYDGDIKASDLVVIVLAAVTVVLAALALAIGGLAVWGFGEIRRAAEGAATSAATNVATEVARKVAAATANRTVFSSERALQSQGETPIDVDSTRPDRLGAALSRDDTEV